MKKIYLIAAVIAILAGFATYFFATQLKVKSETVNESLSPVVVALRDIPSDTIITADMLQVISLPVSSITYGTVIDINSVVGLMTNTDLVAGEQVIAKKLSIVGTISAEKRLSYQLEPGQYAFSISLDELNGVSGFLKQGDFINIYKVESGSTTLLLQNIQILRLSTYAANKSQELEGIEITAYNEVVLILTEEQISTITQAENIKISLVSYAEGAGIVGDLIEETSAHGEIQTNYGMGEITTEPPTTVAAQ